MGRSYHYLYYFHLDYYPRLCCYYYNVLSNVPSGLDQVLVDRGNFQRITIVLYCIKGLIREIDDIVIMSSIRGPGSGGLDSVEMAPSIIVHIK